MIYIDQQPGQTKPSAQSCPANPLIHVFQILKEGVEMLSWSACGWATEQKPRMSLGIFRRDKKMVLETTKQFWLGKDQKQTKTCRVS